MVWRAVGWLLLAMAVAVAVRDLLAWWTEGAIHLLQLGELWSRFDYAALSGIQSAVTRDLWAGLWIWVIWPVLTVPAGLAFALAGAVLLWLGRRRTGVEPTVLTGSRPRRRRSRSALS